MRSRGELLPQLCRSCSCIDTLTESWPLGARRLDDGWVAPPKTTYIGPVHGDNWRNVLFLPWSAHRFPRYHLSASALPCALCTRTPCVVIPKGHQEPAFIFQQAFGDWNLPVADGPRAAKNAPTATIWGLIFRRLRHASNDQRSIVGVRTGLLDVEMGRAGALAGVRDELGSARRRSQLDDSYYP